MEIALRISFYEFTTATLYEKNFYIKFLFTSAFYVLKFKIGM